MHHACPQTHGWAGSQQVNMLSDTDVSCRPEEIMVLLQLSSSWRITESVQGFRIQMTLIIIHFIIEPFSEAACTPVVWSGRREKWWLVSWHWLLIFDHWLVCFCPVLDPRGYSLMCRHPTVSCCSEKPAKWSQHTVLLHKVFKMKWIRIKLRSTLLHLKIRNK